MKSVQMSQMYTAAQAAQIKRAAKQKGLTTAAYIRQAALEKSEANA